MSYFYWIFPSYACFFDVSRACARKIFLQTQILLRFKVNSIENKMPRGGFYEGTFYRAFCRCSHPVNFATDFQFWLAESWFKGLRICSPPCNSVALFSVPCRKGERGEERGREKEEPLNVERPLVAILRSDLAACIYPFVSPYVIL